MARRHWNSFPLIFADSGAILILRFNHSAQDSYKKRSALMEEIKGI